MTGTVIAGFDPGEDDAFRLVLSVARLPTGDLHGADLLFFRMTDDTGLIGYVGIEGCGPDRLLRSLVLVHSRQRQGHGRRLVEWLESWARDGEVERLHLLKTKAARFFQTLGYVIADRSTAPASSARSGQFTLLCPASATYMIKVLA